MAIDLAPQRKNIVFIMADQLGARHLGCYGSGVDSTPGLDRLAAAGTRFDRCYATVPICGPSRATFLTGRSPCVHGMVGNNYALAQDQPTYAHVLRAAGYRTGGFGKFHQTPMHFPDPKRLDFLGFDEGVVTEDPKWPWYEWVKREHPEHAELALAKAWEFWPCYPPPPDLAAKRRLGDRHPEHKAATPWGLMFESSLPAAVHDSTWITDLGLDFMARHVAAQGPAAGREGQPFFCHISYVDPHDPYDPPEPYGSMFRPEAMRDPLPAAWLADDIPTLRQSQRFCGFEKWWDQPAAMRRLRSLYHGSLRYLDDQIARVCDFLRQRGLWDDTIVVFTADHGEMLGDHGLITKGVKPYDAGVRCPLIVAGGGLPAGVNPGLVCTLDFYPTFCDWAGAPEADRPPLEGRSFAAVTDPDRWDAVAVGFDSVQSVLTADGWRLTRFVDDGKGQMFDLRADPDEQRNLYHEPAHAGRRTALLEQLVAVMNRGQRQRHYRNLPVLGGRKLDLANDRVVGTRRLYTPPPSPALDGSRGREMAGE